MKHAIWTLVGVLVCAAAWGQEPDPKWEGGAQKKSADWVAALDSREQEERERAEYHLKLAGPEVLPLLKETLPKAGRFAQESVRSLIEYLSGPLAESGTLVRRLGAPLAQDREAAEAKILEVGARLVPILKDAMRYDPDEGVRTRAETLLRTKIRYRIDAEPALKAVGDHTEIVAKGTTDLPDRTILTALLYARFEMEGGGTRRSFIDSRRLIAEKGSLEFTMKPPGKMAAGYYELELQVDMQRQYPKVKSLLFVDERSRQAEPVGGKQPGTTILLTLGTPEQIAREQETGKGRILSSLERLGGLYGGLNVKVFGLGIEPAAAEKPDPELISRLEKMLSQLNSEDYTKRYKAMEEIRGISQGDELTIWGALRSGDEELRGKAQKVLQELQRYWEREVEVINELMWAPPGEIIGQVKMAQPRYHRFGESEDAAISLGKELVRLGKELVRKGLGMPPVDPEPQIPGRARRPAPPQPEGEQGPAPTLQSWLTDYEKATQKFVNDTVRDYLMTVERIARNSHELYLAVLREEKTKEEWKTEFEEFQKDLNRIGEKTKEEAVSSEENSNLRNKIARLLAQRADDLTALYAQTEELLALYDKGVTEGKRDKALVAEKLEQLETDQQKIRSEVAQGEVRFGEVSANRKKGEVSFPGWVALDRGLIELFACSEGGKAYESALAFKCRPMDIYFGLRHIGLRPGLAPNLKGGEKGPQGDLVDIFVEWTDKEGNTVRRRAEDLILSVKDNKPLGRRGWVFVGSQFLKDKDPNTGKEMEIFLANATGTVITTWYDRSAILHTASRYGYDDSAFHINPEVMPDPRTRVNVVIEPISREEQEKMIEEMRKEGIAEPTGEGGVPTARPEDVPPPPEDDK